MNAEQLKARTKDFGLRVIRLCASLPKNRVRDVIGRQVLRSATPVGANYRAACRGRSSAEFAAKMGTVEEEADETGYWIEMLVDSGQIAQARVADLLKEAVELTAIAAASRKTARRHSARQSSVTNRESSIPNWQLAIGNRQSP